MITDLRAVRVEKLILSGPSNLIGNIRFAEILEESPLTPGVEDRLPMAKPLFNNISHYPTKNEIVYVCMGPRSDFNTSGLPRLYYFPPMNIYGSPNHNAQANILLEEEVNQNSETGVNNFFQEVESIRPLKPYDGDVILEGRYGQSIRFGSTISGSVEKIEENKWSNVGDDPGNPITIIRNGQVGEEDMASYNHILENINGDDSSIYLCSNQQIKNFQKSGVSPKDHPASYKHML